MGEENAGNSRDCSSYFLAQLSPFFDNSPPPSTFLPPLTENSLKVIALNKVDNHPIRRPLSVFVVKSAKKENKVVKVYNYRLFESLVTCRLKYIKVFVNDVLVILKQLIRH